MLFRSIFDVGGVLMLINGPKKEYALHPINMSRQMAKYLRVSLAVWKKGIEKYHYTASIGKLRKSKILTKLSEYFNIDTIKLENLFRKAYKNNFRRNNLLYNFAFKLKSKGFKIAILSDQWELSKECCIKPEDYKRFNASIVSCEVGFKKPDLRIYKLTLKKLGVLPSEVVFIDNKQVNVLAAKKLGMKAILFKNNSQCIYELKKIGVRL